MHISRLTSNFSARDSVAAAVEEQFHAMEADGHGELVVDQHCDGVGLSFGAIQVNAENYDIALLRLARAILDDPHIGHELLTRLRSLSTSLR
jgi:hypothetical protein